MFDYLLGLNLFDINARDDVRLRIGVPEILRAIRVGVGGSCAPGCESGMD